MPPILCHSPSGTAASGPPQVRSTSWSIVSRMARAMSRSLTPWQLRHKAVCIERAKFPCHRFRLGVTIGALTSSLPTLTRRNRDWMLLNDMLLPSRNGTARINHNLVSPDCLFLIEAAELHRHMAFSAKSVSNPNMTRPPPRASTGHPIFFQFLLHKPPFQDPPSPQTDFPSQPQCDTVHTCAKNDAPCPIFDSDIRARLV